MDLLRRGGLAVFNFIVGDLRILIGVLAGLALAGLTVRWSPPAAGVLLVAVVIGTLLVSLRHEVPRR